MDSLPVRPGDVVGGRYRIEALLGSTMTSAVFMATHVELDQRLAVKFLLKDMSTSDALKRFRREAKLMGRIQSEHVTRVVDFGLAHEQLPYIVMEYLEGTDLQRTARERGPLDVGTACAYVLQACEGLASAHAAGIIHRDIKPSNLFMSVRADGSTLIKIIDFGIAKLPQNPDPNDTFTRTDVLLGTPRYMSPEQTQGVVADAKTDVWSLALVLEEIITGRPVFKADSFPALFLKINNEAPTKLRELAPDAPEALERVILRALEKNPAARSSVAELARGIAPFAGRGADERAERIEQLARMRAPLDSASTPNPEPAPAELPADDEQVARPSWDRTTRKMEDAPATQDAMLTPVVQPRPMRRARLVMLLGASGVILAAMVGVLGARARAGRSKATSPQESAAAPSAAASLSASALPPTTTPVVTTPTSAPSASVTSTSTSTIRGPGPTATVRPPPHPTSSTLEIPPNPYRLDGGKR